MASLCLILGDQLSLNMSSLQMINKRTDRVVMAEVKEEASYVPHHKKKITFVFSAMRHFAKELRQHGYTVDYFHYQEAQPSLYAACQSVIAQHDIDRVVITEPGEYRLLEAFKRWEKRSGIHTEILPDDRFLASHDEFKQWADDRKTLTMEYWYREMRKRTGLLMENNKPIGEVWNFDKDNRKALPKSVSIPPALEFSPDKITKDVMRLVNDEFSHHFGDIDPFYYAVTRSQAEQVLEYFLKQQLASFGDYQDAMKTGEAFLFHSVISHYINIGLLDPLAVCRQAEDQYHHNKAPLNAVEGFIRQIIGWREFIRGIYWYHMPEYAEMNTLKAKRPLPDFYWTAKTDMHCLAEVVQLTKQHAYSHHIQRLMVTGNFANLAGLEVAQVCEWYLAVYADAYEWVELPNTLGMALYADGGIVGSKPYISGGAYINRMSDFCKHCQFDPKQRVGEEACPFTNLYWNYLIQHRKTLQNNRRMSLAYRNLDRFSKEEQNAISKQAKRFLKGLNP